MSEASDIDELKKKLAKIDRTQGVILDALEKTQASMDQLIAIVESHANRIDRIEAQLRGQNERN